MNRMNYQKIRDEIRKNENSDKILIELIEFTEGLYLDYFMINLEFEMVSFVEGSNESKYTPQIKQDPMLEKAYLHFAKLIDNPSYLFEIPNNDGILDLLNHYRLEMEKRVKSLAAYSDLSKIFEYMINRRENEMNNSPLDTDTDEAFCGEILGFLFQEEDAVLINDKIKAIYSQLPFRITSNRFLNYIDAALDMLKGVPCKDLDRYAESICETFYPENTEGFGTYFNEISDGLRSLEKITETSLSQEEYSVITDKLKIVTEKIEQAIDCILDMVHIVNQLLGVASVINEKSIASNLKRIEHFTLLSKQINHQKVEFEDAPEINELLSELEGVIEDMANDLSQSEVMVESTLIGYKERLEALKLLGRYEKVLSLSVLTSGSFFGDMSPHNKSNVEVVDLQYLSKTKKLLENFMEEKMQGEDKEKQRARIAITFSVLNIIHKTPQEVYNFILDALKGCRNLGEKDISKKIIRSIIQA